MITKVFLKAINQYKSPLSSQKNDYYTVIDVGAANGRLAKKLIHLLKSNGINCHYVLIEPSSQQLRAAQNNLKSLIDSSCKISFINSTIEEYDGKTKANYLVSSGGPLNVQIVKREQALLNAKKMYGMLQPGGIMVATGFTSLLVKRKNFEQMGFECVSDSVSASLGQLVETLNNHNKKEEADYIKNRIMFFGLLQRYVLKKKINNKTENKNESTNNENLQEKQSVGMSIGAITGIALFIISAYMIYKTFFQENSCDAT